MVRRNGGIFRIRRVKRAVADQFAPCGSFLFELQAVGTVVEDAAVESGGIKGSAGTAFFGVYAVFQGGAGNAPFGIEARDLEQQLSAVQYITHGTVKGGRTVFQLKNGDLIKRSVFGQFNGAP